MEINILTKAGERSSAVVPPLPQADSFLEQVYSLLEKIRRVPRERIAADIPKPSILSGRSPVVDILPLVSSALRRISKDQEAGAIDQVLEKATDKNAFGGLELSKSGPATSAQYSKVLFLTEAWLESLNSQDNATNQFSPLDVRSDKTKPMNLAPKIFAHHSVDRCAVEGLAMET